MGQDEVASGIVGALFRFIIVELQGGTAYAAMQTCPCQIVVGVKVIWIHIPHVAGGVYQAVRWVCQDGNGAPKVAEKKAKSMPLAGIASSSVTHCLKVDLDVLDKV